MGRSPEKLQIFLCYSPIPFCPVRELKPLTIVPLFNWWELLLAVFKAIGRSSFPLGKAGMGLADGWCAPLATPSELLLLTGRCLHVPLPLLPLTGCCLYVPLALLLLAGRCLHVPLPLLLLTGCSSHVLCALLLLAACSSHLLCALLLLAGLTLSPLPLSIHR